MKKILNSSLRVYIALFAIAGSFAFAAQPATASDNKGCWYEPGSEPSCSICGWDCSDGQVCCTVSVG